LLKVATICLNILLKVVLLKHFVLKSCDILLKLAKACLARNRYFIKQQKYKLESYCLPVTRTRESNFPGCLAGEAHGSAIGASAPTKATRRTDGAPGVFREYTIHRLCSHA
jgi:hypothetical protein